jgi:hypothetical protein
MRIRDEKGNETRLRVGFLWELTPIIERRSRLNVDVAWTRTASHTHFEFSAWSDDGWKVCLRLNHSSLDEILFYGHPYETALDDICCGASLNGKLVRDENLRPLVDGDRLVLDEQRFTAHQDADDDAPLPSWAIATTTAEARHVALLAGDGGAGFALASLVDLKAHHVGLREWFREALDGSSSPQGRAAAALGLADLARAGGIDRSSTEKLLRAKLDASHLLERLAVATALDELEPAGSNVGQPQLVLTLQTALEQPEREMPTFIGRSVARITDASTLEKMLILARSAAADSVHGRRRTIAADVLEALAKRLPAAAEALASLASDSDHAVRVHALAALDRLTR